MPLDASIAGTTSTSYLSLADANAMAINFGLLNWAGLTDDQKNAALFRATVDIESHRVHDPQPCKNGQSLRFPRETDLDALSGQPIIPTPVLWACMYQADFHGGNGESDMKSYEGGKGSPLKDSGAGSPLCPRAFRAFSIYISRTGNYITTYWGGDAIDRLYLLFMAKGN